jgi:ketosteroid isomerase-like protein
MKHLLYSAVAILFFTACNQSNSNVKPNDNSEANKALLNQFYLHFNNHDWTKMADLYIDKPEMKDPAYGLKSITMTKAEIIKKYTELQSMFPDVHDSILRMYPSADHMIVEFESKGTSADGSTFLLPICTIFEIKNGRITKDFTYYDNF